MLGPMAPVKRSRRQAAPFSQACAAPLINVVIALNAEESSL